MDRESTQVSTENLGMRKLLEKHKLWDSFKSKMGNDKSKGKDKEANDDDEDDDNEDDEDDEATSVTREEAINHIAINNDISTLIDHYLLSQESNDSFRTLEKIAGTPIAMFCSTPSSDYVKTHNKEQGKCTPFVRVKVDLKSFIFKRLQLCGSYRKGREYHQIDL